MDTNISNYYPSKVLKFCPRCGSSKFLFEGKNYFHCRTCDFKHFINHISTSTAFIENDKGELLLTKRRIEPKKGMLDLPGGFVELGENLEEGVKREIKEELNLNVIESQYFFSCPNEYLYGGIVCFPLDVFFKCKVENFKNLKPDDDVEDIIFVKIENIELDKIAFESTKKAIERYRELMKNG